MRFSLFVALFSLFMGASCQQGTDEARVEEDLNRIQGYIDSRPVTARELKRVSKSLKDVTALNQGEEAAELDPSKVEREAWMHIALLIEAQGAGVRVNEQEIDEFIRSNRRFQTDYRFDPTRYETVLSQLDIEPGQFRRTVRDWLLIEKWFTSIREEIEVNEEELKEAFWEAYELRKASYVTFPFEQYLDANSVSPSGEGKPVGDLQEEIKRAEEKSLAEAEAHRDAVREAMNEGGLSFKEAALGLGLEVRETGYFSRNVPPAGIAQPDWMWSEAFLMSLGDLSSVVPVGEGYLFFTLTEIFPPTEEQYARAKGNFLSSYRRMKGAERIEEMKNRLRSKIRVIRQHSNDRASSGG